MDSNTIRTNLTFSLDEMYKKAKEMNIRGVAFSGALSEEDLEVAKHGIATMKKFL